MTEKVFTHKTEDLRYKICECSGCGVIARCTPSMDFYGEMGDPLLCESCLLKDMGVKKEMMHVIPDGDGLQQVSKEEFVDYVTKHEEGKQ